MTLEELMELYSALVEREKRSNKFFAAVMGADIDGEGSSDERVVSLDSALTEFGGIGIETVG